MIGCCHYYYYLANLLVEENTGEFGEFTKVKDNGTLTKGFPSMYNF